MLAPRDIDEYLLPTERRVIYQRLYVVGAPADGLSFNARAASFTEAAARLGVLRLPARRIDLTTREQLLQEARLANWEAGRMAADARAFLLMAAPLNLPPPKLSRQTRLMDPADVKACLDAVSAEMVGLPPYPSAPN